MRSPFALTTAAVHAKRCASVAGMAGYSPDPTKLHTGAAARYSSLTGLNSPVHAFCRIPGVNVAEDRSPDLMHTAFSNGAWCNEFYFFVFYGEKVLGWWDSKVLNKRRDVYNWNFPSMSHERPPDFLQSQMTAQSAATRYKLYGHGTAPSCPQLPPMYGVCILLLRRSCRPASGCQCTCVFTGQAAQQTIELDTANVQLAEC